MKLDKLDSLLRQAVMIGPAEPLSPECLDIHTIFRLLDRPEAFTPEQLEHMTGCGYCQRAIALAKRERGILEAPWAEEQTDAEIVADEVGPGVLDSEVPAEPRTIKITRWRSDLRVLSGIAAVLVVAVGLGLWVTREQELLGPITGRFEFAAVTRADTGDKQRYLVTVELGTEAYLTFLYLDDTRTVKLPSDAERQAKKLPAGPHSFPIEKITYDPPGPQWIAAIASEKPFNVFALRDGLQATIDALPEDALFDDLIAQLEQGLAKRRDLSFRSHRFQVPSSNAP